MFYQLLCSHMFFDYGWALTPNMIKAKSKGWPLYPILLHAALHATGVLFILLMHGYRDPILFNLAAFQFISHTFIDYTNGQIETKFPRLKDPTNPWHWHIFQIDQFLHITVMYVISIA